MERNPSQLIKKHIFFILSISSICLVSGGIIGYSIKPTQVISSKAVRENTDDYTFISPLLAVNRADTTNPTLGYTDLYKKVQNFVTNQINNTDLKTASVYMINYGKNSGLFSINDSTTYAPASLLKVVVMMGYFKKSEQDKEILNERFTYALGIAHSLETTPFDTPTKLKVGTSYSVSSLIDKMIIDSDNGAMDLLLSHIDDAYLTQVYTDLGLKGPGTDSSMYTISIKDYALFFRILYNSTYLSREDSEKALAILSKTTFNDGLVKGLPAGTLISHKFGEHVNGEGDQIDSIELHDCGIIYNSHGPYLLCVMTKGKSLSSLSATISGVSKIVYDDISSR